jgi:hypothetical protein
MFFFLYCLGAISARLRPVPRHPRQPGGDEPRLGLPGARGRASRAPAPPRPAWPARAPAGASIGPARRDPRLRRRASPRPLRHDAPPPPRIPNASIRWDGGQTLTCPTRPRQRPRCRILFPESRPVRRRSAGRPARQPEPAAPFAPPLSVFYPVVRDRQRPGSGRVRVLGNDGFPDFGLDRACGKTIRHGPGSAATSRAAGCGL